MRKITLAFSALAASFAAVAPANAVTFSGTTLGCFGTGCTPGASAVTGGLSFTGGSFTQNDSGGFFSIGSVAENLGTFTLTGAPQTYTGPFTLQIDWTSPAGAAPDPVNFSSTLSGTVGDNNSGGALIDFAAIPLNFTYNGGVFDFVINDVSPNAGGVAAQITGFGHVTQAPTPAVPEASTWAMMLVGFGAAGAAMRRSRRKNAMLAQIA